MWIMARKTEQGSKNETGVNRRKAMLVAGGAVATAGALLASPFRDELKTAGRQALASTGVGRGILSLAEGSYDEWAGEVGATFSLGGRTSIRLVGIRPLNSGGARPQGVRSQSFAAFFEPVGGQSIAPDLIYTAVHPAYGPLPIHLAAAGDARAPGQMVAVFG